jgi:hypothetical protein
MLICLDLPHFFLVFNNMYYFYNQNFEKHALFCLK